MKRRVKRILSLVLILTMIFTGLNYSPAVVKAAGEDITDWVQLSGTSVSGATAYASASVSFGDAGLRGFYDTAGTATHWNNISENDAIWTEPVFGFVIRGAHPTAITIDGVEYAGNDENVKIGNDCVFINQSLLTAEAGTTEYYTITPVGSETGTFVLRVDGKRAAAPTNLEVDNYGQYTGKYFVVFTPSADAVSYNIYVDGTLIKNVSGSGYYLTSDELADFANGEHTLGVTSVDVNSSESAAVTQTFTIYDKGNFDDIPQVYISTQGRAISGEYYKNQVNGTVDVNVAIVDNSGTYGDIIDSLSDIKIRGNTTAGGEKKPYNIKLGSKKSVLGMDSAKKWSLLANAFDKSLMRNTLAMQLGQVLGLDYTSDCRYVDVYCNGEYLGNYLLIESVETGTGRVEIDAEGVTSNDILLEIDNNGRDIGETYHLDKTGLGVWFMVNEPELAPTDTEGIAAYEEKFTNTSALLNNFEAALIADDYNEMSKYIDMDSFAKFYILSEIFRTQDFNFSSTRFYVKDNIIYAGPAWDYDLSSGNLGSYYNNEAGMNSATQSKATELKWYEYLMNNEQFTALVAQYYEQYLPDIRALFDGTKAESGYGIDGILNNYINSFERNYLSKTELGAGWSVTEPDQADEYSYANNREWLTYEETVEYLRSWLSARNTWLVTQLGVDDPNQEASIINKDGQVTVKWNDTTGIAVDHYRITYSKFVSFDTGTYTATSTLTTVTAAADVSSIVITDAIDGNTEVKVEAVDASGTAATVGTTTAKPDLKITEINYTNPPVAGQSVTFTLKVENIGTAVAYPANDVVTSIVKVDGTQVDYTAAYKNAVLPNAAVKDYTFTMNWNDSTSGHHTIQAMIDERYKVDESNEGNNTMTIYLAIDTEVARPAAVTTSVDETGNAFVTVEAAEGQAAAGYKYDIYVDGVLTFNEVDAATYELGELTSGTHKITVYSKLDGNSSISVEANLVIEETIIPDDPEPVKSNKLVAFEYDGTNSVAGADMTEYADSDDDYTYLATEGSGTMTASITGTNLKHIEWGDSADYGVAVPLMAASATNPWSADAYVAYTFQTKDYTGLTASVDVGGTKKGPKNLAIGYYDASGIFQIITTYSIPTNKALFTITFNLPETLENQDSVTIYIKLSDTTNIGGNDMTDALYNTGGELAINNFVVTTTSELPDDPEPETYLNKIAAFEYDGTEATAGNDMVEYADPSDDYSYYATIGNGKMTASVTGTELRHIEWGAPADYGFAVPIMSASSKNPWSIDAYVAYNFSTKDYTGLKASVDVGGTKKGPKNFVIGYYDADGIFQSITTYSIAKNKTMYTVQFDLPEVLQNKDDVTIYVKLADTTNIGGNEMTDAAYITGGELAINNFVVYYESDIENILPENISGLSTDATFTSVSAEWKAPANGETCNAYLYDEQGTLLDSKENVTSYSYNQATANTAYQLKVTTVLEGVEAAGVATIIRTNATSEDIAVTGYQMTTSLGGVSGVIGMRTIYQKEQTVNGQTVEELGLVWGLDNGSITDADMLINSDSMYVVHYAATDIGKLSVQMGDSTTADYYVMTMDTAGAYDQNYKVRVYAILEDGSVAYGTVETYNIVDVAKELYDNQKMSTGTAHEALYNVITSVEPSYEKVDYNWNNTLVNKPESVTGTVNVEGFQMSASLGGVQGTMGLRVIYSTEGNYEEAGLIYGLVYNNGLTALDITLENAADTSNLYVVSYAATEEGLMSVKLGSSDTAAYYARTMNVSDLSTAAYTATYLVRAYAKSEDGTVTYSDVYSYTVNDVAAQLYDNDLMSTFVGHEALYNNILAKVNPDYQEVEYNWSGAVVHK